MLTVADVMTREVVSVAPETPISEVAKLMCTKYISGLPVIDRDNRVIGIISEVDLIRHAALLGEQRRPWWASAFASARALADDYIRTHGHTAAEVMAAPVITTSPTVSVAECANILSRHRVERVLVMEDGNLLGVVTRSDLLQALAATDVAPLVRVDDRGIRARLFAELETKRWAHLPSKNITVKDGVINISGFAESEDERHALRLAAEKVPGVKRVQDRCRTRPLFRMG